MTRAPGGGWQDKHYLAGAIALEGLGGLFFVVGNDLGAQLLACAPHPRGPPSRARPVGAPSASRVAASSEAPSGRLAQLIFLATVTPIMHDFWTIKDTSSSEYLVNMSAHPCASLSGPAIALARKPPDLIFHTPLLCSHVLQEPEPCGRAAILSWHAERDGCAQSRQEQGQELLGGSSNDVHNVSTDKTQRTEECIRAVISAARCKT